MTRRHFWTFASALFFFRQAIAGSQRRILVDSAQTEKIRAALAGGGAFAGAAEVLRRNAEAALKAGPWSVTNHRPAGVQAGPNDYYSEGPYWWPDPKNPSGPYIRKDGERYPGRFMGNRNDLGNFCTAVLALGMGATLLRDKRCAEHAGLVLSVWCVDPKTRMNPNLEFGQAVRGINTGRSTGIIDTVSLIHVAQGVALLAGKDLLEARVVDGVERWFADYLHWMTTSPKGLEEKKSGNNHATWWTAQAAAYASLLGDAAAQRMAWEHYRNYLVPTEIEPNGSCPREEARTNSLSYSAMNLDAFSVLCRVAQSDGEDLWHYRTSRGIGVATAFDYVLPYVRHPETWKKPQISRFNPESVVFPGLAGVGLPNSVLLDGYRALPHLRSPWNQLVDLTVRTA